LAELAVTGVGRGQVDMIRNRFPVALHVFLLSIAGGSLQAQDLSIGGRLGLVGGEVVFENKESNDLQHPIPGVQIGAVAAYQPHSVLGVQAELWYIQKGWIETPADGGRRLTYVELPVFVTLTVPWTTAPQLVAGVSGSLELGCSVTGIPEVGSVSCDDPRVAWRRTKAQFGTWVGLGLRRWFGAGHLDMQLLGNLNLTNLNGDPLPPGYARLFSLTVSAAYTIALGRR
jgi:hypothetical protein